MYSFVLENRRWLAAGFLLTFASAFGQTWFISLFAGQIKAQHGLSDGAWGGLYTLATLAAAVLLFARGSLADTMPLPRLAAITAGLFAAAGLVFAFSPWVWLMGIALFLLRFCGQGMFSHLAMTAMGRWFRARRGQAVSISSLGYPVGEIVLPPLSVLAIGMFGWRGAWIAVALLLILVVLPLARRLFAESRMAQNPAQDRETAGLRGRHWNRGEALRHWLFPALLPTMLTPAFVGTVVFFHQVHIGEVKGWTLAQMAPGYSAFAIFTVVSTLIAGWVADRIGPHRLLPVLLLPTSIGVTIIGPGDSVVFWYLALGLLGIAQGMSTALWGALLPILYGSRNLGSMRSLFTTVMVVSTAVGPGITGVLIDWGIDFPSQAILIGAWCTALCIANAMIQARITRELW